MISLTEETKSAIKDSVELKAKLMIVMGVSEQQVKNCLSTESKRLTELGTLAVISEHLKQPIIDLLQGDDLNTLIFTKS